MNEQAVKFSPINIGVVGENDARVFVWDISEWLDTYGEGTVQLIHKRDEDQLPYPCTIDRLENLAKWTVKAGDLGHGGYGECQLTYTVGDTIVAKSQIYKTFSTKSIDGGTVDPPSAAETWVDKILAAAERAEDSAKSAEESAESAAESAQTALESTTNASHIDFEVRLDGHVWMIKTGPAPDDIDFKLTDGRLVAIYGN